MTGDDVQVCIDYIAKFEIKAQSKEHYRALAEGITEWVAPGGKQDLSFISKNRLGKVIRG